MANRTRKNEVKIYLNDDEKKLLDEKVRLAEMNSISAFIRNLIIYGFVYLVDYSDLKDISRQLGGIATNINQIAHKANTTNSVVKDDTEKLQKEMREVWRTVKSMLSEQVLDRQ